ncbi:MAG TPA: hypothetical protein VGK05_10130 [Acidimicrobiia bacterium]|jgi:hypothetical protein
MAGTVAFVGFNPFRKQVRRGSDILILVAALAIVAALLLWAVVPR